jgi:hypothetical protein
MRFVRVERAELDGSQIQVERHVARDQATVREASASATCARRFSSSLPYLLGAPR